MVNVTSGNTRSLTTYRPFYSYYNKQSRNGLDYGPVLVSKNCCRPKANCRGPNANHHGPNVMPNISGGIWSLQQQVGDRIFGILTSPPRTQMGFLVEYGLYNNTQCLQSDAIVPTTPAYTRTKHHNEVCLFLGQYQMIMRKGTLITSCRSRACQFDDEQCWKVRQVWWKIQFHLGTSSDDCHGDLIALILCSICLPPCHSAIRPFQNPIRLLNGWRNRT